MITKRDTETGRGQQRGGNREMEPFNTEIPQVKRYRRQGQNERSDQERARCPVDAVCRDAKNQGNGEIFSPAPERLVPQTLLQWATENNIFFFPGMNAATMGTGEFLCFHFRRRPALFFDCSSGIGQF